MKILSDFDGVLTNLDSEAARVAEIFRNNLTTFAGASGHHVMGLMEQVEQEMHRFPHSHGWRVLDRITAFCNEDGFIRVNALAACLDDWSSHREEVSTLQKDLQIKGFRDFKALAQNAYETMVAETAAGKQHPIDDRTQVVLQALIDKGAEVVVVSNSGTERILQLLNGAGLNAVPHGAGTGPLRVRGNARKFLLGDSPRTFPVGPYLVDTHRPSYEAILREEKPDVVIGDVFSLDLALPLHLAASGDKDFQKLQVVLRKRAYSPDWSLEHLTHGLGREVTGGIFDRLDQLLELV